jgi:MFS family permease
MPAIARLVDAGGRGRLMTIGTLLTAGTSLCFVFVDTIGPLLFVLRILQGLGFALAFNAAATLVADGAPPARLGQAIGLFGVAMLCTNALAPAVAEMIADRFGYDPVFILAGGSAALAAVLTRFVSEPARASDAALESKFRPSKRRLTRSEWSVFVVASLAGVALGSVFTFSQPFALSLGMNKVSGLFIAYTIAAILVRLTAGTLADRFGRRRVSAASLVVYAGFVTATAAMQPGMLEVVGLGIGLAHGIFYPALNAFALERCPPEQRGRVMTYYNGAFNAGWGSSVLCLGFVAEWAGYPVIFVFTGFLTLCGALILFTLPPPAPQALAAQPKG